MGLGSGEERGLLGSGSRIGLEGVEGYLSLTGERCMARWALRALFVDCGVEHPVVDAGCQQTVLLCLGAGEGEVRDAGI